MQKILLCVFFTQIAHLAVSAQYSFVFEGQVRNYNVHLPTGYSSQNSYPLVFNFHGYTSNAMQQELYSQMSAVADAEGFIVCYPDGLNNAWNVGFNIGQPYSSGVNDVGFVNAMIDTLSANFSVDLNRVYACGMSNGGYLSHRLACELPHRIVAVASVTGSMTDSTNAHCQPFRPVPAMQVHGTADPIVNYNGTFNSMPVEDVLDFWEQQNGCLNTAVDTIPLANISTSDSCTVDKFVWNNCASGLENWFYRVNNGGHTWPGGLIDIPTYGHTNRDFNASQHIWDFFEQYHLGMFMDTEQPQSPLVVSVFPNPASDFIQISQPGIAYEIRNLNGQLILQGVSSGTPVSLQGIANGLYVVHFPTGGIRSQLFWIAPF